MAKKFKKSSPIWILGIMSVIIILIINLVFSAKISEYKKKLNESEIIKKGKINLDQLCPDAYGGSEYSLLRIKYFYSKFCPWCMKEEPILQKLAENYSNFVFIEWYSISNCPDLVKKYKVSGVPTFVFSTLDNETEYSHYGFIYEEDLVKLICNVTGGC